MSQVRCPECNSVVDQSEALSGLKGRQVCCAQCGIQLLISGPSRPWLIQLLFSLGVPGLVLVATSSLWLFLASAIVPMVLEYFLRPDPHSLAAKDIRVRAGMLRKKPAPETSSD